MKHTEELLKKMFKEQMHMIAEAMVKKMQTVAESEQAIKKAI